MANTIIDVNRAPGQTRPAPLRCSKLVIIGHINSGTNPTAEYGEELFDCDVEPKIWNRRKPCAPKHEGNGMIYVGDLKRWKHSPPDKPLGLPQWHDGQRLLVIQCVRDPVTWLESCSRNPYDVWRLEGGKRKHGDPTWLLKPLVVKLREKDLGLEDMHFKNASHLWAHWAWHYWKMSWIGSDTSRPQAVVLPQEALLENLSAVVQHLAALGLPRNNAILRYLPNSKNVLESREEMQERSSRIYAEYEGTQL